METQKQKLALVFGSVPTVDEIDQFQLIKDAFDVRVISSESIGNYLAETSYFQDLTCLALKDYDDNPSYLPGLEKALNDFDVVIVKERLGIYAYQAVKAKFKKRFRLIIWVDNLMPFPAEDIDQMRTVRREVTDAADAFIVQSKAAREVLELEGVEPSRIIDFPVFVEKRVERDKKVRAEAIASMGFAEGDFVITHFGQIEQEEGLMDLAMALKVAAKKDASFARRARLVLCGIGSYSSQLRQVLVNLGMDDRAAYIAPSRRASETLLAASDAIYLSTVPGRDRVDGDPYRLLSAMVHEVPIVASRSPIVEEYCGKHRIDFCAGSSSSLADALLKAVSADAIKHDIVKKNAATVKKLAVRETVAEEMTVAVRGVVERHELVVQSSIDQRVLEVESRVKNKQYIDAIDIIETIFKQPDVPLHHRSNLYRLIGDCFAKLGDNDNAKDSYIQAVELDGYSAKAYIGLGTIGLVKGSCDIAVLHFQKAVALAPDDEMANLGLGLAFQGMDELNEASRWVVKSLELSPDNTAALYTLVKIAYELNSYKPVEAALRRYMGQHPNDYNMLYTLAGVLFKQGGNQEVLELMERIIKTDPMDSRALALYKQARRAREESEVTAVSK